jgi:type VI secretion system Hcp family effector
MANGNILMKLTGTKSKWITGEARYKDRTDWIEIESMTQTATSPGSFQQGTGGGQGAVVMHDLQITKSPDRSSVLLLGVINTSEHLSEIIIEHRKGTGATALPWLKVKLTNVRISSYTLSTHSGSPGSESMAFNYEKAEFTYSQQDEKGNKTGGDVVHMVDLVERH